MSHGDATQWTCDKCNKSVSLPKGTTPEGWQVIKAVPVAEREAAREWEICPACYHQTERLLMNHDNRDKA